MKRIIVFVAENVFYIFFFFFFLLRDLRKTQNKSNLFASYKQTKYHHTQFWNAENMQKYAIYKLWFKILVS